MFHGVNKDAKDAKIFLFKINNFFLCDPGVLREPDKRRVGFTPNTVDLRLIAVIPAKAEIYLFFVLNCNVDSRLRGNDD